MSNTKESLCDTLSAPFVLLIEHIIGRSADESTHFSIGNILQILLYVFFQSQAHNAQFCKR